jgi:hypothetical protein
MPGRQAPERLRPSALRQQAAFGAGGRACTAGSSADVFAIGSQNGDQRIDLDAFGAGGNDELGNDAFVDGFDFHRRLVGFDLGDHIAGLDRIAFLDQPLGEVALFHGRREGRHRDVDRHRNTLPLLLVADGFHRLDDFVDIRKRELFEVGGVRHRHVLAGDRQDRRIEIIEGLLHDAGGDFGADRVLRIAFLDGDQRRSS